MLSVAFLILSLRFLGVIRTAILLIPAIFRSDFLDPTQGVWICFITASLWVLPRIDGAFEARNLSRERMILLCFLSGCLYGALFFPMPPLLFFLGVAVPLFMLRVFSLIRLPVARVFVLPEYWKWIASFLFVLSFLERMI